MATNIDVDYRKQGYQQIAGLDEAGRGAWAGPLIAAAVIMPTNRYISGVRDSKKLSSRQRLRLYYEIIDQATCWSVACVTPAEIDQLGVHQANYLALSYALTHLERVPDLALVDGFLIPHYLPVQAVIGGDDLSYTIAAASIVAKVTRDRLLSMLHTQEPRYGFAQHKGYGTARHQQSLEEFGPTVWHRRSFAPVQRLLYN